MDIDKLNGEFLINQFKEINRYIFLVISILLNYGIHSATNDFVDLLSFHYFSPHTTAHQTEKQLQIIN